ncbi:hypothetical protein VE04_05661 [Pseudogymnoascus sp. 24MN13]|nr:hypothetical protein VE04_05661 [Pseudogymnoascus sp. 24MN13]
MTLVFRAESGPLSQIQIGPADVLATFAAAYTASGWLGGLDGVRNLLSLSSQFFSASSKAKQDKLLQGLFKENLQLQSSVFHILTSEHGPVRCKIPTSQTAFGGEQITKIIGFTICALAHEGGYDTAVTLFMEYLAPSIFDGSPELVGALQSQLCENTTMHRLTNEGATLGLPTLFLEVSQRLDNEYVGPTEWHFVIGLLRWLGSGMKSAYLTRSGLVARVAGYLQAVGYGIASIVTWQGSPPLPYISSPMTVVLVLGGSEETDTLMEDLSARVFVDAVMHYTYSTVEAMLHQSLFPYTTASPQVFQSDFDEIYDSIQSRLRTEYHLKAEEHGGSLCVACHCKPASTASPIAMSTVLASVLNREERDASGPEDGLTQPIVRFREYTAAILISLIASLSRDDFRNFKHTILLDLSHSCDLRVGCRFVDRSFSSFVKFDEAVQLLATIHAAHDFEFKESGTSYIVGWRRGIYCVIPNILLDMKPTAESITLACHDVFYANIRVHEDGSIRSAVSKNIIPDSIHLEDRMVLGADLSVIEMTQQPWVGPARTTPPNRPLYLGLERPLHYNDPDICFVGRIDGTVIGAVSVLDVLRGVALSILQPQECHHEKPMDVVNVQTSTWIDKKGSIPVGSVQTPALLSVKDDPSWALFAMGQSLYHRSCIVLRCVSCAHQAAVHHKGTGDGTVLIGYR